MLDPYFIKALSNDSVGAAPLLLGALLSVDSAEGRTSGYIVETEAYAPHDPASHTFHGKTVRNEAMFMGAGTVYVYFTYGAHFCVNLVSGPVGSGQGVLIRALEPVEGIELMRQRRGKITDLTNGPGKLTQALGIGRDHDKMSLNTGDIWLLPGMQPKDITQTTRIGITRAADEPWRFYITGNSYVSKK